jgi:capsular polysaccharide biosynthesis protein
MPKAGQGDTAAVTGLYDVLSRGQVPATYAELLRNQSLETNALEQLELSTEASREVSLEVLVVPETSVLYITVTAERAELAERVAAAALTQSDGYLSGLDTPYTVVIVGNGSAQREGLSSLPLAAVVWAVAALAGVSVQQAVVALIGARRVGAEPVEPAARLVPVQESGELPGPSPGRSQTAQGPRDVPSGADSRT